MTNRTQADLHFGPGSSGGFTPAGVAAFDNLRPAAVVRELIQNALDAGRIAGASPTVVRFRLSRASKKEIPGIRSYEVAFQKAVNTQEVMAGGWLSGQAGLTVKAIHEALEQEEMDVLSVLDNGVGLNEQRMNALMSDGVSVKGDIGATGTYGNGHSTAIPASDLRYILYGGVTKERNRIGAGHAVLASHYEEGEIHHRSGDGFLVEGFCASPSSLYNYPAEDRIPKLIARELDQIEKKGPHGTAVVIPFFNHFREKKADNDLWAMVSHAASANFFIAVAENDLIVCVEDDRPNASKRQRCLNNRNLLDVLNTHREKRRARAFLNGRRAFEAHQVYKNGEQSFIETNGGRIDIRIRDKRDGITRVDLCRNGMWVTDRIPIVSGGMADRAPFHAVLSLDAQTGGELHDLIRNAEGPLHESIALKRLPSSKRRDCRQELRNIKQWILNNTRSINAGAYSPDDFLTLDFGDVDGGSGGASTIATAGVPVIVEDNPARTRFRVQSDSDDLPLVNGGDGSGTGGTKKSKRARPWLPASFYVASRPIGTNRRKFWVECAKRCLNAELRLVVDEALDATCERPGQDPYVPVTLNNVLISNKPIADECLVRWDNRVVGIRLGDVFEGRSIEIEIDYELHGDFTGLEYSSLRIEIFNSDQDREPTSDPLDDLKNEENNP